MRKSVDHSKWGINAVRKNSDPTIPAESVFPTVCFGDLNRHHNQNNRGSVFGFLYQKQPRKPNPEQ
jgi:hypothetical protein